jgi:hypothetical protein
MENWKLVEITLKSIELLGNSSKMYFKTLENLEEIDKFLDSYDFLRLNQEDINNLNRLVRFNEIESLIKNQFLGQAVVARIFYSRS